MTSSSKKLLSSEASRSGRRSGCRVGRRGAGEDELDVDRVQ